MPQHCQCQPVLADGRALPQRLVWPQALLGLATAFNLNTDLARVLTGPKGTHFGYAVALWADHNDSLRLVVGAPRAGSPADGSLPLGRIHVCPAFSDQCPPDALMPLPTEKGEAQAAVRSSRVLSAQGTGFGETLFAADRPHSRLVACAPRFAMRPRPGSLHGRGACVAVDEAAAPPHAALSIVPFRGNFVRAGGGPRRNDHRYTGIGMAGFSAALDAAQDSVFLGGPYAFFGQGVVARSPAARGRAKDVLSRSTFGPPELDFSGEGWATVLGRFDGVTEMVATSAPNADHARGSIAFYEAASLRPAKVPRLAGTGLAAKFGFSLAAGDWDGDGAADLAAGAPLAHDGMGAPDAGAVYVYYAPAKTVSPRPALEVQGRTAWARFGHALACLGDIDRDGFDDLAVGAPFDGDGGSVHVFHGRPEGLGSEPTQVLRASDFDGSLRGFGFSIDGGIDMDDNGYPDVLVGAATSDSAVFIRSAPVLAVEGAVTFVPPEVSLGNRSCSVSGERARGEAVVCLRVEVALAFSAGRGAEGQPVDVTLQLDPQQGRLVFVSHEQSQISYRANLSAEGGPADVRTFEVYVLPGRPRIDLPLAAAASIALLPSQEDPQVDPQVGPGPAGEATRVPPVLAQNRPRVIQGHGRLTCDDPLTCFSSPDLSLTAAPGQSLTAGEEARIAVELSVGVAAAPAVRLTVSFPAPLSFRHVSSRRLLPQCQPSAAGPSAAGPSDRSTVVCSFQSELRRDMKIPLVLTFAAAPLALADLLLTAPGAALRLRFTASSDSEDLHPEDNSLDLAVPLRLHHHVFALGSSAPEAVQAFANQSLNLQELMDPRVPSDTPPARLGPPVAFTYTLANHGPSPLVGAKLVLDVPLRVPSGLPLFYLVEAPVGSPALSCSGPALNPLGFQVSRDAAQSDAAGAAEPPPGVATFPAADGNPTAAATERNRRSIHRDFPSASAPREASAEALSGPMDDRSHLILSCDNIVCESFVCELPPMLSGDSVAVSVAGFLVVSTLETARHGLLMVESALSVETRQAGGNTSRPSRLAAVRTPVYVLRERAPHDLLSLDWFYYVAAATAGLLLVVVLVAVLHKIGFFKRTRFQPLASGDDACEREAVLGGLSQE
ncbi:integrin alpha-5-like isoform X3 [Penaeus chinensis]|uniref:integrin alpha-5-like isoform X3 n=1 Tax=Penaeus chinensis TaxID=139456 RepID=UPI001FB67D9B|nr:integrin alpha-5-like isoform X3 [Penaeus chinensis]